MPRPVKMRPSYRSDASFLLRLEDAVLKDTRRTSTWRNKVAKQVRRLSIMLLEAAAPDADSSGGTDQQKGRRPRVRRALPEAAPSQ